MQKKVNIIHLIPSLGIGGAEKILLDFCRKINREKYHLTVAYWGGREDLLGSIEDAGVKVVKLKIKNVKSVNSVFRISRLLRDVSAELIHTHFMDADLMGFLASRISRIPVVMNIHSYPFPVGFRHCLRYRLMSLGAGRILCVSNTVKNHLVSQVGINPDRISVTYNGIDFEKLSILKSEDKKKELKRSLGVKENCRVIGNVSRLTFDKGQKYLILAAPRVLEKYPEAKFLIIGDGELREKLTELTRELNIRDSVIFAGSRDDVPDLLSIMDIFVFPTFNEAMGISVLEAMAAGKPIVATDDAAIPEIIQDGKEGLLVHPGDRDALARAILRLLDDPGSIREMGAFAKERVKIFSDEAMVRRIEKVYDELLKKKNRF